LFSHKYEVEHQADAQWCPRCRRPLPQVRQAS
jgi:hypothetical protein